jgi:ATP-binding cassette, subfamily B, multidrug efflux pump
MPSPFIPLLPYLLRYKRAFLLGLACVVTTTAIQLLSPWVLKNAIDDLNAGVTRGKLAMYAALLLAIALAGGAFRFLMRRILIGASREIEYDMRNAFFARLQQMPLAYYQARRTGDLMSRATNDLNAVRTMIGPAVMYSANTIIVFVVAIILMASIDGRLTLIALLPLPLVSISVKYFGSAIHTRFEAIQAQLADLSAVVQEALSGVRVVRAYNQEPHEMARFRAANDEYVRRNRVLIRLQGMFYPSMTLFLGFGSLLVLWMGSREAIRGRISVGEFVAFNAYLVMLSWPMIAFGWVTNILQRGMASWKRMLEVLDATPEIDDRAVSPAGRAVVIRGTIDVRDLTFTYPTSNSPALDRVSLRIEAGETAAFIGATGSGKSTLINLLPRLHEPPPGTIFLDGVDVREIPLATLRAAIGFVPQEPFLFSDTIAENIAFGVEPPPPRTTQTTDGPPTTRIPQTTDAPRITQTPQTTDAPPTTRTTQTTDGPRTTRITQTTDAPRITQTPQTSDGAADSLDARIRAAAAIARLDKDVETFPNGYDTLVGERGITLSGGQKQRTAIARALMVDPRLLILDDALSAVDTYTEEEILTRLHGVMRHRTSLIVSHRVSTVRDADQIFVLDRGRIAEQGRHDELVASGGLYATLHRRQLLEEELAAS